MMMQVFNNNIIFFNFLKTKFQQIDVLEKIESDIA